MAADDERGHGCETSAGAGTAWGSGGTRAGTGDGEGAIRGGAHGRGAELLRSRARWILAAPVTGDAGRDESGRGLLEH